MEDIQNEEDIGSRDAVETPAEPKRKFVGYKTLVFATLIAAALGTLGGGAISQFSASPVSDLTPLTAQLEKLASENQTLKARLSRFERDIKKPSPVQNIDLSVIQSRLAALEEADPPTLAPAIDADILSRLEALQEDGSEALDLSAILGRLEKLEERPLQIAQTSEGDQQALTEIIKSEILADAEFIETISVNQNKAMITDADTAEMASPKTPDIPFPKTAILKALNEADASQSWLKRTLNKHITVQSEDNPRYLVELIELDINGENFSGAVTKFDKLPQTAKIAGKAWREAFEGQ